MTPKIFATKLERAVRAHLSVLVQSAPGVGKIDIALQVGAKLKMHIQLFHPAVSDPMDFKGLPGIVNNRAEFLPYGELRRLIEATVPTLAILDDIGQAPSSVQAALMQLLLAREINGKKISDKVVFVACTNRREDLSGVTGILEAVKSRFHVIWTLEPSAEDWIEWVYEHDMPDELIAWVNLKAQTDFLTNYKPTRDIINHICPRTLAHAGDLINADLRDVEDLQGALGPGGGTELFGFLGKFHQIPNPVTIIQKPEQAIVPTDAAVLYAVVAALVGRATVTNGRNILTYGRRLPREYASLLVRDVIRRVPELQNTRPFIDWAAENNQNMS